MSRISDEELRRILAEATPGPWELRDAESYDGRSTTHYKEVWDDNLNVIASEAHRAHGDGGRSNMRLIALSPALAAEVLRLREALTEIANIRERTENKYLADWHEQIAACPECQRYKDHPIQQGICNDHRKPIYAQRAHDTHETRMLGFRAQSIARAALTGGHLNV